MENDSTLSMDVKKKSKISISFYFLLIGDVLSRIGDYVYQLAIPLYVYSITQSAVWMGMSFAIEQSALILSGIFMGTIVDRGNPLKIVRVNALIQIVLVCSLPITHIIGVLNVYYILTVGFILIASNFLYRTAINSLIPSIVEKQKLPIAAGRFSLGRSLSKTIGPLLAAFFIAAFSPIGSLWIDGISFLLVFGVMLLIKIPPESMEVEKSNKEEKEKENFFQSVKQGFGIVFKNRNVFPLVSFNFFLNIGFVGMFSMMTFHLKDTLQLSTQEIGYVFMMDGVGAFVAAMYLPILMKRIHNGYLILISAILMGVAILLAGVLEHIIIIGLLFGIVMFASQINNRTLYTIWQMKIPKNQLGRVFSFSTMIEGISVPVAGLLAGIIISKFNSNILMVCAGVTVLAVAIYFTLFSKIRQIDNRT